MGSPKRTHRIFFFPIFSISWINNVAQFFTANYFVQMSLHLRNREIVLNNYYWEENKAGIKHIQINTKHARQSSHYSGKPYLYLLYVRLVLCLLLFRKKYFLLLEIFYTMQYIDFHSTCLTNKWKN